MPFPSIRWQSTQDTAVEEIAVVFLKSGYRLSSSNPCIRAEAWGVVVAVALPFFAAAGVAIAVHPSPTYRRPSWSPPLALFPASIPAISGDKTNIVGCARAWCTFLLLGATSDSPPFAADVDVKPAGR
uniref:Uncharacterized protein n=1 Tax=Oryza glumipatula TaxID=40148 RepID=A0A0D9YRU7_9ORYZ